MITQVSDRRNKWQIWESNPGPCDAKAALKLLFAQNLEGLALEIFFK